MAQVRGFDFDGRVEHALELQDVPDACASGLFCWLDLEVDDVADAAAVLERLGLAGELLQLDELADWLEFHDSCIEFAVTEGRLTEEGFATRPVKVVLSRQVLVTVDHAGARFLERMRRSYREDFLTVAQSPGFLVFEIADHLVAVYRKTLSGLSAQNESLQARMFGDVDEGVFQATAELIGRLLAFRRLLVAAGEVVDELVARRSPFLAETTKPHLQQRAARIDLLAGEVLNERDALTTSLSLYLGMTGHRTNLIITRLTMVSFVFLPLSFLVGVYGMNFEVIPEYGWRYGYAYFWGLVLLVLGIVTVLVRRWR